MQKSLVLKTSSLQRVSLEMRFREALWINRFGEGSLQRIVLGRMSIISGESLEKSFSREEEDEEDGLHGDAP